MTGLCVYADQRPFHLGFLGPVRFLGVANPREVLQALDPEHRSADVEDGIQLVQEGVAGIGILFAPGEADTLDIE